VYLDGSSASIGHERQPSAAWFLAASMAQYPIMSGTGWRLVSTIAIDEVWSALPSSG
jgi:hypothetical protein